VKVDLSTEAHGFVLDVVVEGAGSKSAGRRRLIAIGEAKSSDRQRSMGDLHRLERLRGELARRADVDGTKLLLFGRSGFESGLVAAAEARSDVELVDLERMYEGT